MSVTFKEFLDSAESLLKNPESTEIDFRNLMSRSYYALFHLSKEKSDYLNLPSPKLPERLKNRKIGSHEEVFFKYAYHESNKHLQKLGGMMSEPKAARTKADYDIHEDIGRKEAAEHFFAVKALITKLEQLNPN